MPRPPPPNAALMASGQPYSLPKARISSADGDELGGAGHDRCAAALGGLARADLVAHLVDRLGRRADERDALGGDGPGEVGVLAEEAVAGVHAVGAALLDGVEDGLGVEVALGRGLAAERVRLVGEADVEGVAIEFGVHRDGRDAELAGGPDDADGDLATVGDQDLCQHGWQYLRNGHPWCHTADRRAPRVARRLARRGGRRDRQHERRSARRGRRRGAGSHACWWPATRPPGAAGSTAGGRRRRARTCSCRCCSASVPEHPHELTQRVALAAVAAARAVAGVRRRS